jgi:hypothetical protein
MGLYFHNDAGSPVWIVYGYYAPDCEGGVTWANFCSWGFSEVPQESFKYHSFE